MFDGEGVLHGGGFEVLGDSHGVMVGVVMMVVGAFNLQLSKFYFSAGVQRASQAVKSATL